MKRRHICLGKLNVMHIPITVEPPVATPFRKRPPILNDQFFFSKYQKFPSRYIWNLLLATTSRKRPRPLMNLNVPVGDHLTDNGEEIGYKVLQHYCIHGSLRDGNFSIGSTEYFLEIDLSHE